MGVLNLLKTTSRIVPEGLRGGRVPQEARARRVGARERLGPFLTFVPVAATGQNIKESVWIQPGIQPYEPVMQMCAGSI